MGVTYGYIKIDDSELSNLKTGVEIDDLNLEDNRYFDLIKYWDIIHYAVARQKNPTSTISSEFLYPKDEVSFYTKEQGDRWERGKLSTEEFNEIDDLFEKSFSYIHKDRLGDIVQYLKSIHYGSNMDPMVISEMERLGVYRCNIDMFIDSIDIFKEMLKFMEHAQHEKCHLIVDMSC